MSNRMKTFVGLLVYVTLNSYFFGVVFSGNRSNVVLGSALVAVAMSQGIALFLLRLIKRTEL